MVMLPSPGTDPKMSRVPISGLSSRFFGFDRPEAAKGPAFENGPELASVLLEVRHKPNDHFPGVRSWPEEAREQHACCRMERRGSRPEPRKSLHAGRLG